jgi:hypothetical protein
MVDEYLNHWLLIGRMGSGKSTLASQMTPEYAVLDFDGRWVEQRDNVLGTYHIIQNDNAIRVIQQMEALRPTLKGKVGTVIVDSGTALLDYEQSLDRLKGEKANDAFRRKADLMRVLSGAILRWQCNSVWIFHIEDSMINGQHKVRQTLPNTELERLKKSLNAVLEVFADEKARKRGVKITWCRHNDNAAAGQIIWDVEGKWVGMPERISLFLRSFSGNEGYNGNAYSLKWLWSFLALKGKEFADLNDMRNQLGIDEIPAWFDRNAWGEFIRRTGI